MHGLPHQVFHLFELCRRGLFVVVSQDHAANLRRAHVAGEVDPDALLFESGKILAAKSANLE